MQSIENLKITIVERSNAVCNILRSEFRDCPNVTVWQGDVRRFFAEHKDEIDCLVSPANAFGYMTGGFDAALSDILGWDFQKKVQQYIRDHFYGEQVVGSSFYIETDSPGIALIHTPTMQYPSYIKDDMMVYYCMRSTLICALEHDVKSIVIPVFGASCGGVDEFVAAGRLREAYQQILTRKGAEYLF